MISQQNSLLLFFPLIINKNIIHKKKRAFPSLGKFPQKTFIYIIL